ncbi:glycosyltransferase [Nitrosomonadaceae bacterium]|nr:glycosyltransferase [Nitrosomonadaceae bacterium]
MNDESTEITNRGWVLHDYMQVNGGAERLVSTIARGYSGFSLGVSGIYPGFSKSKDSSGIDLRVLGEWPHRLPRIPRALLTFGRHLACIENAETVIYSGIYTPLAVKSQNRGRRIYYCHTPPRFAFDKKKEYLQKVPITARHLVSAAIDTYRQAYILALAKMDVILTNSEHVRNRMENILEVEAQVVYPPVDIDVFKWKSQGDYYLSLGRLEPNKRIDLVVKAFMQMPEKKLIVASGGSQLEKLRKLTNGAPNIIFVGWSYDESLIDLIANALACIYIPLDEDFGMSAVEAMAAGKPVIGVAEGGILETVLDGQTGILLPPNPEVRQIILAVCDMNARLALSMRYRCEQRAIDFTEKRFLEQLGSFVFR